MKGATFHRLAWRELAETVEYYEQESPGLGGRFLEEVESAVSLLRRFPEAAPRVSGVVHRFVLPTFPYYLLYRLRPDGRLRILAVGHQRRHPGYWVGRE